MAAGGVGQTNVRATSQTLTIALPSGATVGDRALVVINMVISGSPSSQLITTPSGWIAIRTKVTVGSRYTVIWARDVASGDSTYSLDLGVSATFSACLFLIRGAAIVSTWTKGSDWLRDSSVAADATRVIMPSVTMPSPGGMVMAIATETTTATETDSQVTFSGGSGFAKGSFYNGSGAESIANAYASGIASGVATAAGTFTYPNSQTTNGYGVQIAIPDYVAPPAASVDGIKLVGTSSFAEKTIDVSSGVYLARPAALAVGHYYVVACLMAQGSGSSAVPATPTGFTSIASTAFVTNSRSMAVWGRAINSAADLAAVENVLLKGAFTSTRVAAMGLAFAGVDTSVAAASAAAVVTASATSGLSFTKPTSGSQKFYFTYTNNAAGTDVPKHTPTNRNGAVLRTVVAYDYGSGAAASNQANSVLSCIRDADGVDFSVAAANGGAVGIGLTWVKADTSRGVPCTLWTGSAYVPGRMSLMQPNGARIIPASMDILPAARTVSDIYDAVKRKVPFYIAHRGGGGDWPELTKRAFRNSVGYGMTILEASVWKTTDGVFVLSHDNNLVRTTGQNIDITSATWDQIKNIPVLASTTSNTSQPSQPLWRLDEMLAIYGGKQVIFLDDKGATNTAAIIDIMNANGGPEKFVVKMFRALTNGRVSQYQAAGYKAWGYFYPDDTAENFATAMPFYDFLGQQHDASQAIMDMMRATGKPVIGHIISTAAQRDTILAKGAAGIMTTTPRQTYPLAGAVL